MNELKELLENIEGSYDNFVNAILYYAGKNTSRLDIVLNYIKNNPHTTSSDVVFFVSEQPDFSEDAAYMQVG